MKVVTDPTGYLGELTPNFSKFCTKFFENKDVCCLQSLSSHDRCFLDSSFSDSGPLVA